MEFTVNYPGSFGEILQGKVNNKDILVSCPVDIYTNIRVFECNNAYKKFNNNKSAEFLYNILKLWGHEKYYNNIDIEINSQIPKGKGLASSTADLCGVYYSLLKMFHKEFNEQELIEQCIRIEPTDSIIFKEMTIFDYKRGLFRETVGDYFEYNILAFEANNIVNTVEFNNKSLPPLSDVSDLLVILKEAIKERNLEKLAYVSTNSILRNQKRLYYDFLEEVIRFQKQTFGLGIIGAHSGSVLGILYEDLKSLKLAEKLALDLNICKIYQVNTLRKIDI